MEVKECAWLKLIGIKIPYCLQYILNVLIFKFVFCFEIPIWRNGLIRNSNFRECLGEAHAPSGCEKWREWHSKIAEIKPQECKEMYLDAFFICVCVCMLLF